MRGALLLFFFIQLVLSHEAIDQSNFDEKVLSSGKVWLLEFYSNMCGSCQEFKPTFERLSKKLEGTLNIGTVGIDNKDAMSLAASLGVLDEGIPNLRLFTGKNADKEGIKIMPGQLMSYDQLLQKIQTAVAKLEKSEL